MQADITQLRNQVRSFKRIVCSFCCLFAALAFSGCEEKSAPQTQSKSVPDSPASLTPPAPPAPQVDEMELAKSFAEFANVYAKEMQEYRNNSGSNSRWIVGSVDIVRTQSILHPYKGKIVCEVETDTTETWSTEWLYSPSFNYVDGSWVFASATLDVKRKGSTYSENTSYEGQNLTEITLGLYGSMSELVCNKIKSTD